MADEATPQETATEANETANEAVENATEATTDIGADVQGTETDTQESDKAKAAADPEISRLNKEVDKLRKEAAAARVKGNEKAVQAAQDAATKATSELVEKLRATLGLDPAEPDPAELLKAAEEQKAEFARERDEYAEKLRNYARKDAISDAAKATDGDLDSILDSRKISAAVEKLDTSADDFAAQVAEIVKDAVDSNPKLKKAPAQVAAPRSGGDLSGGNASPSRGSGTVDDIRRAMREKRERDRI